MEKFKKIYFKSYFGIHHYILKYGTKIKEKMLKDGVTFIKGPFRKEN